MGITGLIPLLKEIHRAAHVKDFKGHTLGVDGYVWLHRGVYGCAQELCLGQSTTRYIDYSLSKVKMLRHHGVEPYFVFDGGHLPSKRATDSARSDRRALNMDLGRKLLEQGRKSDARDAFTKAVDVTPEMAHHLIQALKKEKITYVVAPYEADAQLRYLEMHGYITGIITEDSDLLVYGSQHVLFKLDKDGSCVHIARDRFSSLKDINIATWGAKEFRQMAILSGCDYLANIPGMGIKRAYQLIRRFGCAIKAVRFVALEGSLKVPASYTREFRRAEATFMHQLVFDPTTRTIVPLHPLLKDHNVEDLAGCGETMEDSIAIGVAQGDLDPVTKNPFQVNSRTIEHEPLDADVTLPKPSRTTTATQSKKGKQVSIPRNQPKIGNFFSKTPALFKNNRAASISRCDAPSSPKRRAASVMRQSSSPRKVVNSRFFGSHTPAHVNETPVKSPLPGTESLNAVNDENVNTLVDSKTEGVVDGECKGVVDLGDDLASSQMQAVEPTSQPIQIDSDSVGFISSPSASPHKVRYTKRDLSVESEYSLSSSPVQSPNRKRRHEDIDVPEEDDLFEETGTRTPTISPAEGSSHITLFQLPNSATAVRRQDSSDPIDDDSAIFDTPARYTTTTSTLQRGRKGFTVPCPTRSYNTNADESLSPATANVAQGLRQRFMLKQSGSKFKGLRSYKDKGTATPLQEKTTTKPNGPPNKKSRPLTLTSKFLKAGQETSNEEGEECESNLPCNVLVTCPALASFRYRRSRP